MNQQQVVKGCDPEVFLIDSVGKYISSVGLFGGSKDFPRDIGEGCAVQEDNVTVEFNTPPCASAADYIKSIRYNLDYIRTRAEELGYKLAIVPSAVFEDDQLQTEGAKTFGCEPDFNAWKDGAINDRPTCTNPNLRSAGGHIHITIPEGLNHLDIVKAMDWFVGCQMLRFDTDSGRRELYGKAGAFRKKSYGVEYRTASNKWIETDDLISWAWNQTDKAVDWVKNGNSFTEEQGTLIQNCINNSDITLLDQLYGQLPA